MSIKLLDSYQHKGILQVVLRDADTNKVRYFFREHNVITYAGRKMVNFSLAGERSISPISHIAVGTGAYLPSAPLPSTPPPDAAETDVALKNEILRKPVFQPINHTTELASVFEIELGPTECVNQKINEFGLFTADNTLFARRTILSVNKIERMVLTITWTTLT